MAPVFELLMLALLPPVVALLPPMFELLMFLYSRLSGLRNWVAKMATAVSAMMAFLGCYKFSVNAVFQTICW